MDGSGTTVVCWATARRDRTRAGDDQGRRARGLDRREVQVDVPPNLLAHGRFEPAAHLAEIIAEQT
jgi:hypothetical protein